MPVIERKDMLRNIVANLKHLDYVVKVGVQGNEASEHHKSEGSNALTMVELATIHEFGAPSAHISQRAFIRAPADTDRTVWTKELEVQLTRVVNKIEGSGVKGDAKGALTVLGEKYRTAVIKRVKAGIPPPLKEATIDRKGSSTPLIDTGALLRSITSVVSPPHPAGESK